MVSEVNSALFDELIATAPAPRPIGFFIHHHGSGHINRCAAIVDYIKDRPVTVFCAETERFPGVANNVTLRRIPNPHGKPSLTSALHHQPASVAMDCAPLGVTAIREGMGAIASWMATEDPALLVSDVSAEVALLARILSVPAVKVRMHGNRADTAHMAAYSGCVGMLAPFDIRLEQDDWPLHLKSRTFYTGGLIAAEKGAVSRQQARKRLGLPAKQQIICAITGNGAGIGAPFAPLTIAARALPDTLWLALGTAARHGHETAFANLTEVGWVDNVADYIAAADVIVATSGDTLVHEVARVGRPLICIPEWCYYDEQACKAVALSRLNAAIYSPTWPGSFVSWRTLVEQAFTVDIDMQRSLVNPKGAAEAAAYLTSTADRLWLEEAKEPKDPIASDSRATCQLTMDESG